MFIITSIGIENTGDTETHLRCIQECTPRIHTQSDTLIRTERELFIEYINNSLIRPERISKWDCVDYSFKVFDDNPEWKLVTISQTRDFCPKSHMVNYQFFDNTTLVVYDGLLDNMYTINNYQWDCRNYYHFWLEDEIPVRHYVRLFDNREMKSIYRNRKWT